MTEGPQINQGIVISGNASVTDSALAAGPAASAHKGGSDTEGIRAALAAVGELRRRLDALEGTEATQATDAARDEADALAQELAADRVDRSRVTVRLERLRALIGDATALTGLVTAVRESVRAITGG